MTYEERQQRLRQIAEIRQTADRLERELIDGTTGYATTPPMQQPAQRTAVGRVYERLANATLTSAAPTFTTAAGVEAPTSFQEQVAALTTPDAVRSGAYAQARGQLLAGVRQAPVPAIGGQQLFHGARHQSVSASGHGFGSDGLYALGDQTLEGSVTGDNGLAPRRVFEQPRPQLPGQEFHGHAIDWTKAPLAVKKIERAHITRNALKKAALKG